jgi:flagellar basal-body rod protein FlgC
MYGILDISTSALVVNRTLLDVVSTNTANANTILTADGEHLPFRRRIADIAAGDPAGGSPLGVHVAAIREDMGPLREKYEPGSPWADARGIVEYPNINPVIEHINAMQAQRSYEANIAVIEATKSMISVALQMIA